MKDTLSVARQRGRRDPTPIYYRLQNWLREQIEDGRWGPGEGIPPEETLARNHGVSLNTVRKAITNLVTDGYLHRIQGKGTFVSGSTIRRENLRSYLMLRDFGKSEAALTIRMLGTTRVQGTADVRRCLRVRPNQDLYEIKRLLLCQDRPFVYAISYLPVKLFEGLDELSTTRMERKSLYIILEETYRVTTVVQRELFSACLAGGEISERLQVDAGYPLLVIDMLAFTYKKKPYEYRISYCLSDTHRVYREK